jgi:hypothetical protein
MSERTAAPAPAPSVAAPDGSSAATPDLPTPDGGSEAVAPDGGAGLATPDGGAGLTAPDNPAQATRESAAAAAAEAAAFASAAAAIAAEAASAAAAAAAEAAEAAVIAAGLAGKAASAAVGGTGDEPAGAALPGNANAAVTDEAVPAAAADADVAANEADVNVAPAGEIDVEAAPDEEVDVNVAPGDGVDVEAAPDDETEFRGRGLARWTADRRRDLLAYIAVPVVALFAAPALVAFLGIAILGSTSEAPSMCDEVRVVNGCEELTWSLIRAHVLGFLGLWALLWVMPWWRGLRTPRVLLALASGAVLFIAVLRMAV